MAFWCGVIQHRTGEPADIAAVVSWALLASILYGLFLNTLLIGTPFHFWLNPEVPDRPRLVLGYNHALYTGDIIALAIIAMFFTRWSKLIVIMCSGGLLYLLILTDATAARFMVLPCLLIAFVDAGRGFGGKIGRTVLLSAFSVALISLAILDPSLLGQTGQNQRYETLTGRTAIWTAIFGSGLAETMLGTGFDASRPAIQIIYGVAYHAHNQYLSVLVELGVVGAFLFVIVLISWFLSLAKNLSGFQISFGLYALAVSMSNVGMFTRINMMIPFALSFFLNASGVSRRLSVRSPRSTEQHAASLK